MDEIFPGDAEGSGTMPMDWQAGPVIPIFKKGNQRKCSNPGRITPLIPLGKTYAWLLERSLSRRTMWTKWWNSGGTANQLVTVAGVLERSREYAHLVLMLPCGAGEGVYCPYMIEYIEACPTGRTDWGRPTTRWMDHVAHLA